MRTMRTCRVYLNNKRLSTGRLLKDNTFLQVYPDRKQFSSELAWRTEWKTKINEGITFRIELSTPSSQSRKGTKLTPSTSPQVTEEPKVVPGRNSKAKKEMTQTKNGKVIDWTFYPGMKEATAPPGKYYIGDLCYALYESTYDDVFGGAGYDSGLYECKDGFFMVDLTAYGDGAYTGTDGKEYLVDAGIIGIASWKVVDRENPSISGGHIQEFKDPVKIRFGHGTFEFTSGYTHLRIDTTGYDDEEEE